MQQFPTRPIYRFTIKSLHIDSLLLIKIIILTSLGMIILYSASNQNLSMLLHQLVRLIFAFSLMMMLAIIPPHKYKAWTPYLYSISLLLLIAVMVTGKIGKGAQRWLDLGLLRFQPSELLKLTIPMMLACYFDKKNVSADIRTLFMASVIIFVPAFLIAKQPDLGTAIMVMASGLIVVFLTTLSAQLLLIIGLLIGCILPILWFFMHDYQRLRILTLLNPEHDPLGKGYHIIQSKIAIGSGGTFGKGWLSGSQSHLNFLPEHVTDFIFAVGAEEFGFAGCMILLMLILCIALRGLVIAKNAQTNFTRLLAASLAITFFLSAVVNIGMVVGILPVVGIPLPLVSYGGSAMVTFFASFGILMSISSHRVLFL